MLGQRAALALLSISSYFQAPCSPALPRTAASPTLNPLRPREVRWVQADRFTGEKLNPIHIPSFLEALVVPRTLDIHRQTPFRKDSNNHTLYVSPTNSAVSNVLLKCVMSFGYQIHEMRNPSALYVLLVAFVNFCTLNFYRGVVK